MEPVLLVLVRSRPGAPLPPAAWPIARAAAELEAREPGPPVVFGDEVRGGRVDGLRVAAGPTGLGWARVHGAPLRAVVNRYPIRSHREGFLALQAELPDVPFCNPLLFSARTADKLETHRVLAGRPGLRVPELEADPAAFARRLQSWGALFVKPRWGSLGRGVSRVAASEGPDALASAVALARAEAPDRADSVLLQRAVPPPAGLAGAAARVLAQRTPDGAWVFAPPVARLSGDDAVVSVDRGAFVDPVQERFGDAAVDEIRAAAEAAIPALVEGPWDPRHVLELGLDFVLDPEGRPHLIEVNSIPRGRLKALAPRGEPWASAHEEALLRPLRAARALPA